MPSQSVRLDSNVRIPVLEPMRRVNAALLELLRGFDEEDWRRPTIHRDRTVKDLTAHLLQSSLGRVSALRDGFSPPPPNIRSNEDLVAWIQSNNREFMAGMRRTSPQILIELIATYDQEMLAVFERLDPQGEGLGVGWAGELVSQNWFDVAREYTEKWHHQEQLRDATGRPPLYEAELFAPALETFARGLPHAYRDRAASVGTQASIGLTGAVELGWTLRRDSDGWSLWSGITPDAQTSISLPADVAWRVWTKGILPEEAMTKMNVQGDKRLAEPLARFVGIMA